MAFAHPVALSFGGDHGRVMREPVEQRRRQLLVAGEHGHPLGKREIGRDDRRASLVPIGDQIEQQLAADPVERDEPDLVDLCGAPHKSTNATPAVMWSEVSSIRQKRAATLVPTPHY